MEKIRNIAKITMFVAVLGLLFHDFASHHHHTENNNDLTCHHHQNADLQKLNSFSIEINKANSQHQHLNHSVYSHFYKHIVFDFTCVENYTIDFVKIVENKELKVSEFIQTKAYKQQFHHSLFRRGPPTA